jgi:hypothetical protein
VRKMRTGNQKPGVAVMGRFPYRDVNDLGE